MLLRDYLAQQEITQTEFAKIAKIHVRSIQNILNGASISLRIAYMIREASGGAVDYSDLLSLKQKVDKNKKYRKTNAKKKKVLK